MLTNLDAVSVREKTGVEICEQVGIRAQNVCDPTLLLSAGRYDQLIEDSLRGGVFIYNINIHKSDDIFFKELKAMADRRHIPVNVCMGGGYELSTEFFGDDVNYCYGTMSQFLGGIKNAQLVVACSFHCVVFAIIFHKQFVYVPIKGRHGKSNNRAIDLLNRLKLDGRIFDETNSYDYYLETPTNYERADSFLSEWRKESKAFLIDNLK